MTQNNYHILVSNTARSMILLMKLISSPAYCNPTKKLNKFVNFDLKIFQIDLIPTRYYWMSEHKNNTP